MEKSTYKIKSKLLITFTILCFFTYTKTESQFYVNTGVNLSRINTKNCDQKLYDFGLGYSQGIYYINKLNNFFATRTGIGYMKRIVKPVFDTKTCSSIYGQGDGILINNQDIIYISKEIRTKICKQINTFAGIDACGILNKRETENDEKFIDVNMKFGVSFGIQSFIFDLGYSFSANRYAKVERNSYKHQTLFLNIGFLLF